LIEYSEARKGMVIVGEDGQLYVVVDRDLKTPGNLPSKLRLRLKNLKTGLVTDLRVHPEDKVEQAYLEKRELEYLYRDSDGLVFMDTEIFDQETLAENLVGDMMPYLKEGNKAQVVFHEGKPLSLELPSTVDLEIKQTEAGAKGAPGAVQYKPAILETGLEVTVPAFINIGDIVSIDTRTGKYLGRAKA